MKNLLLIIGLIFICNKAYSQKDDKPNLFGLYEADVISKLQSDKAYTFQDRSVYDTDIQLLYAVKIGRGISITNVYHFDKTTKKCFKVTELYARELFTFIVDRINNNPDNIKSDEDLEWVNKKSKTRSKVSVSDQYCSISYTVL